MYTPQQAAELLHRTEEDVNARIEKGEIHLSPTEKVSEMEIARKLNRERKVKQKLRFHEVAQSISEINNRSAEMEFRFDGSEWLPISGQNWSAIFWGQASILFMDIGKYPERIKECADCGAIFWDESPNKSAMYCEDRLCINQRNYRNVKKSRKNKQKESSKKFKIKRKSHGEKQ